jgi:antitoxin FitA
MLTINIDDNIKNILEKQARKNGRSLEDEALEILRNSLMEQPKITSNLAAMIEERFAHLQDFQLPAITRDSIRTIPDFEQ